MASTVADLQTAAAAAGFGLGFGFLTTCEAIKQTRANKSPLRSIYIYMVWGEIIANLAIGIIGWLVLTGHLKPTYVHPKHKDSGSLLTPCWNSGAVLRPLLLGV